MIGLAISVLKSNNENYTSLEQRMRDARGNYAIIKWN